MRIASLLCGVALMALAPASAPADTPLEPPPIELPSDLQPYSSVDEVVGAAQTIIKLLGTAKFDKPAPESPFSKAPCDSPEIASFYRGMMLMQAGYFIFVNKMERGFEATDSPHLSDSVFYGAPITAFGALFRPGRELLAMAWDQNKLKRLVSLVDEVRNLPPEVKADLAAYFRVLREFSQRHDSLRRRAPKELEEINRHGSRLYFYMRLSDSPEQQKMYPKALLYEEYAKGMRQLLDANRDIGMSRVSECFDGGQFAKLRLGQDDEITYDPYGLYPASYLVGFWQRRDAQGTTALARFAIDRVLEALTSPQ